LTQNISDTFKCSPHPPPPPSLIFLKSKISPHSPLHCYRHYMGSQLITHYNRWKKYIYTWVKKSAQTQFAPTLYRPRWLFRSFPLWRKLKNIINMCIGPPQRFLMYNRMQLFCSFIENGGCVSRVEEGWKFRKQSKNLHIPLLALNLSSICIAGGRLPDLADGREMTEPTRRMVREGGFFNLSGFHVAALTKCSESRLIYSAKMIPRFNKSCGFSIFFW